MFEHPTCRTVSERTSNHTVTLSKDAVPSGVRTVDLENRRCCYMNPRSSTADKYGACIGSHSLVVYGTASRPVGRGFESRVQQLFKVEGPKGRQKLTENDASMHHFQLGPCTGVVLQVNDFFRRRGPKFLRCGTAALCMMCRKQDGSSH